MHKIKFGTDGWRAVIADEFTVSNVRAVTHAIASFLEEEKRESDGVVVGYDNRFLAEEFAAHCSLALMSRGIKVYLCQRPAPTPAVAFAVTHWKTAGAVMFTASHNPSRYQGIKFIPHYAGPAMPEETDRISELLSYYLQEENKEKDEKDQKMFNERLNQLRDLLDENNEETESGTFNGLDSPKASLEFIEPAGPYFEHLEKIIDVQAIAAAPPFVVIDAMHGAGIGYLEAFLGPLGCSMEVIRGYRDPFFGGGLPDPSRANLEKLRGLVLELQAGVGLALDGDADRLGVIGPDGEYLGANEILTLFLEHLVQNRKWQGVVVRTVATTHNLDRLAGYYNLGLQETPVGFKYIGQVLREQEAFLGGEESGGVSIRGHIPEKDGIMAALLFVEMLAVTGKRPDELFGEIGKKVKLFCSNRWDIHTSHHKKEEVLQKLETWHPASIAGLEVEKINRIDGLKAHMKGGSWFLIRSSGTEDLFRIYIEAPEETLLEELKNGVRQELGI
ncbi:MAG: phosphoglucomutase/phosphomannomutase family protein [Bacillota bacterium]|nr:phosphoglucomutase/phosphomannomutase family protein [Bacillota bacterium]